jgi:hypothetical protein
MGVAVIVTLTSHLRADFSSVLSGAHLNEVK